MRTVDVALGAHAYPIYIGPGLITDKTAFNEHALGRQVMLVTNQTVADLYLASVMPALADLESHVKILPDGEQYKNLHTLNLIFDALLAVPCDRRTTIIALGGGVIGDIAGFAAACYQRGIGLIQVPTTLLAQVDSSVGGKTGVNHAKGKNMIGAFHQPAAVIADTDTLSTLPDRELRAGIAEVIKYGLIRDYEFFCWLEENIDQVIDGDPHCLMHCVETSCRNKADVVIADEREKGERALLNFGHTFGHAIETAAGYGTWLHGEAVAAGMIMAADLSVRLQNITTRDFDRIAALIDKAQLPGSPPGEITPARFLQLMSVDKKVDRGNIRLVLLRAIGQAYLCDDYPLDKLNETLQNYHTE